MPDTMFTVEHVAEDALPEGHEWVLVRKPRTESEPPRKWLFIRRDASTDALVDAKRALREIHGRDVA